jgi:hypothetical protein
MAGNWKRRAVSAGLGLALVAGSATAIGEDVGILTHLSTLADGRVIGAGGDGSLVYFTSIFSISPDESLPSAEDLADKPFLFPNEDLFVWDRDADTVEHFTTTSNIENEEGTDLLVETFNDQPSVDSRSFRAFEPLADDPKTVRVTAVAFRSNADQDVPGPTVAPDGVDSQVLARPNGVIYVWDSERDEFNSVFEFFFLPASTAALSQPSLALAARPRMEKIKGHNDDVITGGEIREILVAFAGNADIDDNQDGNDEIFLWSRRSFLDENGNPAGGTVRNGGVEQITHTIEGSGRSPAVSRRGEVAFISTSDIVGRNGDGSEELFLWSRARGFRQLTDITEGAFGVPRWSGNGRTLVFDSTGDLVRRNPDLSPEIFAWNGRSIRQVTEATIGSSTGASVDASGRSIAFVSDANTKGVVAESGTPEVVVARRGGRTVGQVTGSTPGTTNEAPVVSSRGGGLEVIFVSDGNFTGRNSNLARRIYTARLK